MLKEITQQSNLRSQNKSKNSNYLNLRTKSISPNLAIFPRRIDQAHLTRLIYHKENESEFDVYPKKEALYIT